MAQPKGSVFIAASVDGFIARLDESIDWLDGPPGPTDSPGASETAEPIEPTQHDDDEHGFEAFMDSVDALVMGRNSFEVVLAMGVEWPYNKPVFVLSSRALEIPPELAGRVEHLNATPVEVVDELSARGMSRLYIDGGKTIQAFLNAGLIQRFIITRIPVLLGSGIPLFGPLSEEIWLRHIETKTLSGGLVQQEYEVKTSGIETTA